MKFKLVPATGILFAVIGLFTGGPIGAGVGFLFGLGFGLFFWAIGVFCDHIGGDDNSKNK